MPAQTSVQSISVELRIKTRELTREAKAARDSAQKALGEVLYLPVRLKPPSDASVKRVSDTIAKSLNANLQKSTELTPKFTVKPAAIKQLREDIEHQLGKQLIVGVRWNKTDLTALKPDILRAVGIVDVPFTYHWKDGPPSEDDFVPSKGGPRGSGSGTGSAKAKADATAKEEATVRETERKAKATRERIVKTKEAAAKAEETAAKTAKAKADTKARAEAAKTVVDKTPVERPEPTKSLSGQKVPKPRKEPKPATGSAPPVTAEAPAAAPARTPEEAAREKQREQAKTLEMARAYEHSNYLNNVGGEREERDRDQMGRARRLAQPLPTKVNPQRAAYAEMMAQQDRAAMAAQRKAGGGGPGYKRGQEVSRGLELARTTDTRAGTEIIANALSYGKNDPDIAWDTAISMVDAQTAFLSGNTEQAVGLARTGGRALRHLNPRMAKRLQKANDPRRGKPLEYTNFQTGEVMQSGLEAELILSAIPGAYARQLRLENNANEANQKAAAEGLAGTRSSQGRIEGADVEKLQEKLADQTAPLLAQRSQRTGEAILTGELTGSENEPSEPKLVTPKTAEQARREESARRRKLQQEADRREGIFPEPGRNIGHREAPVLSDPWQELLNKAKSEAAGISAKKRKEMSTLGALAGPTKGGAPLGVEARADKLENFFSADVLDRVPLAKLLQMIEGRAKGGQVGNSAIQMFGQLSEAALLQMLQSTVNDKGQIKPGMETRSQQLNRAIEQRRGGWPGRAGGGPIRFSGGMTPFGAVSSYYLNRIENVLPYDQEAFYNKKHSVVDRSQAIKLLKRAYLAEEGEEHYPDILRAEGRALGGRVAGERSPNYDPRRTRRWTELSKKVRAEEPHCRYCGAPTEHADHMDPVERGGDMWDRANLAGACATCNKRKGKMTASEFVLKLNGKSLGGQTARGLYRVGEGGKEFFHSKSGKHDQWLVGDQIWAAPDDGYITPSFKIPGEIRNAIPGHARGGGVYGGYRGKLPAQPHSGLGPPYKTYRTEFAGERMAIAAGKLSPEGSVQRVFVVNWPAPGTGGYVRDTARTRTGSPPRPSLEDEEGEVRTGAKGPTGGGTGTGSTAKKGRGGRTPEEREADYLAKRDTVEEFQDRLSATRSSISEALQLVPVRALSVSAGQILQTRFGGRAEILKRAKYAETQVNDAQAEVNELERRRQDVRDAQRAVESAELEFGPDSEQAEAARDVVGRTETLRANQEQRANLATAYAQTQGTIGGLGAQRKELAKQLRKGDIDQAAFDAQKAQLDAVEEAIEKDQAAKRPVRKEGVLTQGEQLKTQAVGLVGIIGGTLLFTGAMKAVQLGLSLVSSAAEKAADALTGFTLTAKEAITTLGQAARTRPGFPEAGVGGALSQLGLSPAMVARLGGVTGVGINLAGAENTQQIINMQRANSLFGNGSMRGIVPGLGGDLRNGLFGTFLQQTPSIGESLAGELNRLSTSVVVPSEKATPQQLAQWAQLSGQDRTVRSIQKLFSGDVNLADLSGLVGGTSKPIWGSPIVADVQAQQQFISDMNEMAMRGARGTGFNAEQAIPLTADNKVLVQATIDAFTDAGRADLGQALVGAGFVLPGAGGGAPTDVDVNRFLAQYGRGTLIPNAQEAYQSMRGPLAMQQATNDMRAQFARDRELPLQFGWQQFLNRPLAPGIGVPGGAALPETAEYQKRLGELAAPGIAHIKAEVDPAVFQELDDLSGRIQSLSERQIKINVDFQEKQFQSQLKLAVRQGGDLLGLAGKQSQYVHGQLVDVTEMGRLQREQLQIGRAQTELELKRSQRQINFGLAQAQINVPGATPAEMASFLADAQLQAAEDQKALDLSKRGFKVGTRIEDISISREAQDFIDITLPQMLEGHEIQIESSKLNDAVTYATQLRDNLAVVGETYTTNVLTNEKLVRDTQLEISNASGEWVDSINAAATAYENVHRAQLGLPPVSATSTGWEGGGIAPGPTHARGMVGMTNGMTALGYAGEAGGELVAVLRNPRPMDLGGWASGGGVSVQINFNGTSVRDDSDIDRLARKVEDVMNRRALSIGLV